MTDQVTDSVTTDEPKPGSVSFWERIGKLGLSGLATLGLLGLSGTMAYQCKEVPEWLIGLTVGATGATIYFKSKGK